MPQIAILIVNYRSAPLALNCLASLAADGFSRQRARVVLVDNASADGSVEQLRDAIAEHAWTDWVTLIAAPRNGGFAAGNNLGLRHVLESPDPPAHILLLNPDTLVHPITVEALARFLDQHPRAAIAGSHLFDAAGTVQCGAHRFPSALGELESALQLGLATRLLAPWRVSPPVQNDAHTCDWVSGAALMIRAEAVRKIGLLDEGFFLYFEEVDWCRRAKDAGGEVWHIPASHVAHLEGGSTGVSQTQPAGPHFRASRRRYFRKHHGLLGLWCADACHAMGQAGHALTTPVRALLARHRKQAAAPASVPIAPAPSLNAQHT